MNAHSPRHTIEGLREYAKGHGLEVSRRQIEEWHRAGLLPRAHRTKVPGKEGRGPLVFPDPTPDVVVSLGRWRRYVTSNAVAKVWLWLEGYEHLGDNSEALWRMVKEWITAAWPVLQEMLPGLPDMSTRAAATEEQKGDVLDALDNLVRPPMKDRHPSPHAITATVLLTAAALGLDVRDNWIVAHETDDAAETQTTDPSSLVGSRLLRALFTAGRTPLPDSSLLPADLPLPITDMLPVFSLPRLVHRPVDWTVIRLVWRAVCVITDAPCPYPEAVPLVTPVVDCLRALRRHAYGGGVLGLFLTLKGSAAVGSLLPAHEMKRRARRLLACYGADEGTGTPLEQSRATCT
jgi:hypothetical protein